MNLPAVRNGQDVKKMSSVEKDPPLNSRPVTSLSTKRRAKDSSTPSSVGSVNSGRPQRKYPFICAE